jgi:hypothetical protein
MGHALMSSKLRVHSPAGRAVQLLCAVEIGGQMPSKSKPPHPLEGEHLHATGGGSHGYRITKGIVNPKDAADKPVRVFSVRRTETIEEATVRLEEHIRTHGESIVPHTCYS